jgi:hypothetical protein
MPSPLIQLGWTLAVLLGLYGFYCHWEAGRADLAAAFRRQAQRDGADSFRPDAPGYRARSRWALVGCAILAGGAIASAL